MVLETQIIPYQTETVDVTEFIKDCLIWYTYYYFIIIFSLFEKRLFVLRKTDLGVLQLASQEDDISY